VVHLPFSWTGCGEPNSNRIFPAESANVRIRNGPAQVWQTEGCGKTGKGVVIEKQVLETQTDLALREKGLFYCFLKDFLFLNQSSLKHHYRKNQKIKYGNSSELALIIYLIRLKGKIELNKSRKVTF
jgi:hypothetical protein